jgi:hypothetical protein
MRKVTHIALFVVALLVPLPATANIGVPMVAIFLPPLWLSLVPVIAIEVWIITRRLGLSLKKSIAGVTLGNALSTLVGIPFMWAVMATVQVIFAGGARGLTTFGQKVYAVTVQASWLIPYEKDLGWMIPLALLVLAMPAYFLSVLIEWRALFLFVEVTNRRKTLRAVFLANAASYILLAILFIGVFHFENLMSPLFALFEGVITWFVEGVFTTARFFHGVL